MIQAAATTKHILQRLYATRHPRATSLCDRVAVWLNEGGAGGDDETQKELLEPPASAKLPWFRRAKETDVKPTQLGELTSAVSVCPNPIPRSPTCRTQTSVAVAAW